MPLKIVLLHIGEQDQANRAIIEQMRSTEKKDNKTNLTASITDATQNTTEGTNPVIKVTDDVAGAIIMYDTTREAPFYNCGVWISTFKSCACKEAVVILLADRSFENCHRGRVISEKEGRWFAEKCGALYHEVNSVKPELSKEAFLKIMNTIAEAGFKAGSNASPHGRRHSTSCTTPTNAPKNMFSRDVREVNKLKDELDMERAKLESLELEVRQVAMLKKELAIANQAVERLESEKTAAQKVHTQEKHSLLQTVADKDEELKQVRFSLEQSNSNLQQLNSRVRDMDEYCFKLEQEKQALNIELNDSANIKRQLQQQVASKEEALQNEIGAHSETRVQLREMELVAMEHQQQSSSTTDSWRISRDDITVYNEEVIGHGAWGYVARGEFHGKKVAVKCLHEMIMTGNTLLRVHREISTMATVRHPNIVLFIAAVLEDGGPPLIICELMDTNLRTAYENKQLRSPRTKIEILHGVACALNYLHNLHKPIIHRDISSPNVLLNPTAGVDKWIPKLSDFGSANLAHLSRTLAEGAIIYAAPETYPESHPQPQTTKIDVYSFGVLAKEIVTEEFPNPQTLFSTLPRSIGQWPRLQQMIVDCTNQSPPHRPDMKRIIAEFLNPLLERMAFAPTPTHAQLLSTTQQHTSLPLYLSHQNYTVPAV